MKVMTSKIWSQSIILESAVVVLDVYSLLPKRRIEVPS